MEITLNGELLTVTMSHLSGRLVASTADGRSWNASTYSHLKTRVELSAALDRAFKAEEKAQNLQQMYDDMTTAYKSVCEQLHEVRPDKPI